MLQQIPMRRTGIHDRKEIERKLKKEMEHSNEYIHQLKSMADFAESYGTLLYLENGAKICVPAIISVSESGEVQDLMLDRSEDAPSYLGIRDIEDLEMMLAEFIGRYRMKIIQNKK